MARPPRSPEEERLLSRAKQYLPGGVLGGSRAPSEDLGFVVKRGLAGHVWDVSGREYIDYLLGSGPMVLGHAHPAVVEAVRRQVEDGTTFFWVNEPILELAEELCRAVPCAEQVRFTSTGTEATFFALRAARAFRKRDKIMKFEGGYHGSHDYGLMSSSPKSPKAFPAPTPDSAGIPHVLESEVLIAPYNDIATVESLLALHGEELAAVIVEPFQRIVPPQPGFLAGLRALTQRHGIPLIFDEVVTGFRLAYGGAQERYGVVPDLAALGKIIGGGFPLAALVGRREIMQGFDPELDGSPDFIGQVGTLNGNPVAAVAGLATLRVLREPGAYARIEQAGTRLRDGLAQLVKEAGLPAQVIGEAAVFDVVFTDQPVIDYRGLLGADGALMKAFNTGCFERGVLKGGQKIYISLAHTDDDLARTLDAFRAALAALPARRPRPR